MKLYATHAAKNERFEVYDDNGRAFIKRIGGKRPGDWHSPDRTAAEWVGIQRNASKWKIV